MIPISILLNKFKATKARLKVTIKKTSYYRLETQVNQHHSIIRLKKQHENKSIHAQTNARRQLILSLV